MVPNPRQSTERVKVSRPPLTSTHPASTVNAPKPRTAVMIKACHRAPPVVQLPPCHANGEAMPRDPPPAPLGQSPQSPSCHPERSLGATIMPPDPPQTHRQGTQTPPPEPNGSSQTAVCDVIFEGGGSQYPDGKTSGFIGSTAPGVASLRSDACILERRRGGLSTMTANIGFH